MLHFIYFTLPAAVQHIHCGHTLQLMFFLVSSKTFCFSFSFFFLDILLCFLQILYCHVLESQTGIVYLSILQEVIFFVAKPQVINSSQPLLLSLLGFNHNIFLCCTLLHEVCQFCILVACNSHGILTEGI